MQRKTWRHKIYWAEAARGRLWNSCQRGASEWVAGGLAPGTPNEESLPACLSIQPHQLIWSLSDWQTRGALIGTRGHTHTHKEEGNTRVNRCVPVCAWKGMIMFMFWEGVGGNIEVSCLWQFETVINIQFKTCVMSLKLNFFLIFWCTWKDETEETTAVHLSPCNIAFLSHCPVLSTHSAHTQACAHTNRCHHRCSFKLIISGTASLWCGVLSWLCNAP